jgi:Protein of unknown function (DUF3140)
VTVSKSDEAMNMSVREFEEGLQTEESREVGQKDGGGESRGHESGRGIVEILEKDRDGYTEDAISRMRNVVGYVHRHQAQKPENEEIEDSRWRYSLTQYSNAAHTRASLLRHARPRAGDLELALV